MTREEIGRWIDARPTVFVGSVDGEGFPNLKAMLAPRVREGLGVFYLTTNTSSMRVAQFRRDARAALYFCDEQAFVGVQLRGRMEVLEDAAARRMVWRVGDEEYYPLGVDDPDYCVLRFTAHDGRLYRDYRSENFEIKQ